MLLHATVSKDGRKLRTRRHPSRRITVAKRATVMLLRMRMEYFSRSMEGASTKERAPFRRGGAITYGPICGSKRASSGANTFSATHLSRGLSVRVSWRMNR